MPENVVAKHDVPPDGVDQDELEAAIRADFEHRMSEVRRKVSDLLAHSASREAFTALLGLDGDARHGLMRHVVSNLSGPRTIDGLEALAVFASYFVLDDGEVMVVPDVDEEVESVGMAAIMANHATFGTDPKEDLKAYADRERPKTLVLSDRDERPARGAEILEAIRFNADFTAREEAAREAAYAAFLADDLDAPAPRL